MRYWDDPSLTQLFVGRIGHPKKDRLAEWPVLALKSGDCAKRGRTPCFRSNWVLMEGQTSHVVALH